MEFFSIKPEVFGLDISDSSLKIAKLKKSRAPFFDLASWGEFEIAPRIVKGGEIRDKQALIKIIKEALAKVKGEKLRTKYAVASLPEQKAFLQVIQKPKMTKEELRSAIIYEAENHIPLPIEQVYLDFRVISPSFLKEDSVQEVLVVALPKTIVDSYLSVFKKAGILPKVFETESIAISRALIKNEESQFPLALIDLEETKANFIIFLKNSIRFTSSILVSEGQFALLSEEIKKYVEYFQSHHPEIKKIEKILVSGNSPKLKEISEILSKDLKISVKFGNPWVNILPEGANPKLSPEDSLKYTTALGLALVGVQSK